MNEETLVERARDGDEGALTEIVQTHHKRIYHVALRMCGNVQDAEETLQDTFISAFKALPSFEGRAKLSTWLYRIASNTCLMRKRKYASDPDILSVDEPWIDPDSTDTPRYFVDWTYEPEDLLLDDELQHVMDEAIQDLSSTLRIVFIWRDLEGLSTAETATVLGISQSAVKVRLHRARLKLRESLSEYFAEAQALNTDGT